MQLKLTAVFDLQWIWCLTVKESALLTVKVEIVPNIWNPNLRVLAQMIVLVVSPFDQEGLTSSFAFFLYGILWTIHLQIYITRIGNWLHFLQPSIVSNFWFRFFKSQPTQRGKMVWFVCYISWLCETKIPILNPTSRPIKPHNMNILAPWRSLMYIMHISLVCSVH